jgi:hypothetical protein
MRISILNTDGIIVGDISPIAGLKTSGGMISKVNPQSISLNLPKIGGFICKIGSKKWPTIRYQDLRNSQLLYADIKDENVTLIDSLVHYVAQSNCKSEDVVTLMAKLSAAAQDKAKDLAPVYETNKQQTSISSDAKIAAVSALLNA